MSFHPIAQIDTGAAVAYGIGLLVLIFIVLPFFVTVITQKKRHRFRFSSTPFKFDQRQRPDFADVGHQLRAVMAASFEKQRVLSQAEYRVFAIVEEEIAAHGTGYRVLAQTSLGEILRSNNDDAFHSINSKRVDVLVVDRAGWPFVAIEYQGDGHYLGTGAARDAIKKEALRKAGVAYIEFRKNDTDGHIRSRLRDEFKAAALAKILK